MDEGGNAGPGAGDGQKLGPSERALASLKSFARIAWEECREPLTDAAGSAQLRWEIHSTWTLLVCIYHAEAEAERCQKTWEPQKWRTEAQALRHIFLRHRSARVLAAVLRWLRWAHKWGAPHAGASFSEGTIPSGDVMAQVGGDGSYDRTRRALQLRGVLPGPLQAAPAMHPDGPLQQRGQFHDEDLADEQRLLRQLMLQLRRGDLDGALKLCADGGQAWRTAMLQGMLPFCDNGDEPVGYDEMEEDDEEDLLAAVKEQHADWTECGVVERPSTNNGNPWRRLWKEQCWDTAQRNLQSGSVMGTHELAIYGFCAGHHDALMSVCGGSWADSWWGELHCLKEGLIERLLDADRKEWCDGHIFLGEGDGGHPDMCETPESRAMRSEKICGKLVGVALEELDGVVAQEIKRILARPRTDPTTAPQVRQRASTPFARLQAVIVQSAWDPTQGEVALQMLRNWLSTGLEGAPCPYLVKQFASYYAIWQKEVLTEQCIMDTDGAAGAAPLAQPALSPPNIDDIVKVLVSELSKTASGSWLEQCLKGQAIELIVEHVSAMEVESRLTAFASFLLQLRPSERSFTEGGDYSQRMEVLKRCVWVYWGRFPDEAFRLLVVLARRVMHLDDGHEGELPDIGRCGVSAAASADDMSLGLLSVIVFWVVLRDRAAAEVTLPEAFAGLEQLLGGPIEEEARPQTADDFCRISLEVVVLPLLTDILGSLSVKEPERTLALAPLLQDSSVWVDAFACDAPCSRNLAELEWFVGLLERHANWAAAHSNALAQRKAVAPHLSGFGPGVHVAGGPSDAGAKAEAGSSAARDAVLDWAQPRLARDRPLLEPLQGTQTALPEQRYENLRRAVACHVLFLLLSVFEGTGDFDGAMHDLAVAVAQSPWMLKLLQPRQARVFLERLAFVPTKSPAAVGPVEHLRGQ